MLRVRSLLGVMEVFVEVVGGSHVGTQTLAQAISLWGHWRRAAREVVEEAS